MAKLHYSVIISLDGYVADESGNFDCAEPDEVFLAPHIAEGGNRALPEGVGLALELVDERRFQNGTVYLRYRPNR